MQNTYSKRAELAFQLQIGSKLFPACPIVSLAKQFYSLKNTLGFHGECATDVVSMDKAHYMDDEFIIGIDCEKLLGGQVSLVKTQ
eukprot:14932563-Alexandrium_andersonii.AAC.1